MPTGVFQEVIVSTPSLPPRQTTPPPVDRSIGPYGKWIVVTASDLVLSQQAVASRTDINAVAAEPRIIQRSVLNQPLGPIYGRAMPPEPYIYAIASDGDAWCIGVAWGVGEANQIEQVYINNEPPHASVMVNNYPGSPTQGVDPILAACISGYSDTLIYTVRGESLPVIHSVFKIPSETVEGFPRFSAIIQGQKVYDPREVGHDPGDRTTWAYSTNPSLHLGDLLSDSRYGAGLSVDWTSTAAPDANDETLASGAKRRESGISLSIRAGMGQWIEAMRTYAGCWVVPSGAGVKLVPDRPAASSRTLTAPSFEADTVSIQKKPSSDVPTVVYVHYTDTSQIPWRRKTAEYMQPGVSAGTVRYDPTFVTLEGIQSHEQAYREAKERQLKLLLGDLVFSGRVFDEALGDEIGQVITVTHPHGLVAKEMRLRRVDPVGDGGLEIVADEYSALFYSDDEVTETSVADSDTASALNPDPISALNVVEELFQKNDGIWASRIRISWTKPSYPYVDAYEAQALVGAQVVWSGITKDIEIPTGAVVEEGVSHTCRVRVISTLGASSDWTSTSITPLGNLLKPADVTGLTVYEVAGEVRAYWNEVSDIGVVVYVVKWGPTTTAWTDLENFDVVDTLRWQTRDIPPGTWRIWVTSRDQAGLYAENPVFRDVVVTSDANSFFVGDHDWRTTEASWTLTNVYEYLHTMDGRKDYFSYVAADTTNGIFPNATNTYPNAWASYHSSASSEIVTDPKDFGAVYNGTWRATCDAVELLGGTVTIELGLSDDDISYTWGALVRNAAARYAKVRIQAATTNTISLLSTHRIELRLDVISQTERGIVTTGVGGKATVSLTNDYDSTTAIVLTPAYDNTGEVSAQYDNIDLVSNPNTFDIYVHVNGTLTSGVDVSWTFYGVMSV